MITRTEGWSRRSGGKSSPSHPKSYRVDTNVGAGSVDCQSTTYAAIACVHVDLLGGSEEMPRQTLCVVEHRQNSVPGHVQAYAVR